MIAFGCPITVPEIHERFAKPGIDAVAEPDAIIAPGAPCARRSGGAVAR